MNTSAKSTSVLYLYYAALLLILSLVFFSPLKSLIVLSLHDEKHSHLILIPFISAFFIWREREKIPPPLLQFKPITLIFVTAGLLTAGLSFLPQFSKFPVLRLDLFIFSLLLLIFAITIAFFTKKIIAPFLFSWLFLLLFIPIPELILNYIVEFFRHGSAEVVDRLFSLFRITYIRDSLTFHLPNITIFIAKECSGIRSSIALFITILLAGKMFLDSFQAKIILALFTPLLTIIKNGIRITTLTILADKVDTGWLTNSRLHHNGGIVFFGIILLLLFAIINILQRIETRFFKRRNQ